MKNVPGPSSAPMGPAPSGVTGTPAMSPARRDLLDLLAAQPGPVTVAELAALAHQQPTTIREHLDRLIDDGLARRTATTPRGRGRPAWQYEYTDPIGLSSGNEYAGLAIALAEHIERTSTAPGRDAIAAGERWGQTMLDESGRARTGKGRRRAVVESLATLGFEPRATPAVDAAKLFRCPILAAARRSQTVVCGVHHGLLRAAMTAEGLSPDDVSLFPFSEPGSCLVAFEVP